MLLTPSSLFYFTHYKKLVGLKSLERNKTTYDFIMNTIKSYIYI